MRTKGRDAQPAFILPTKVPYGHGPTETLSSSWVWVCFIEVWAGVGCGGLILIGATGNADQMVSVAVAVLKAGVEAGGAALNGGVMLVV